MHSRVGFGFRFCNMFCAFEILYRVTPKYMGHLVQNMEVLIDLDEVVIEYGTWELWALFFAIMVVSSNRRCFGFSDR